MSRRARPVAVRIAALAFLLAASSCTAERARTLRTAAIQFRTEAIAAIDLLEDMTRREVEAPERPEARAVEEFVRDVMSDTSEKFSFEDMELALDPYAADLGEDSRARGVFFEDLRGQYVSFAAVFDDIERGSLLGRDAVRRAAEPGRRLAVQLTAWAKTIADHPPVLLQHRSAVVSEIREVRRDPGMPDGERYRRLAELRERYLSIKEKEREMQRLSVERCLRAATVGVEIGRLIDEYDDISLDSLHAVLGRALDAAGTLTGRDLGFLKSRTADLVARIRQAPGGSAMMDRAIEAVNRRWLDREREEEGGDG